MKSKLKFVSAVGVRLLTSFWICVWFSLRPYCLTLEKKKKKGKKKWKKEKKKATCWFLSIPKWFCRSFWLLQVVGGLGSIFPFLWFGKDGDSVWATIIRGAQFSAHALRAVCIPLLSTVCSRTRLAPRSHPTLHPFDQPWGSLSGSKLRPHSSFCWPGCSSFEVPAQCNSVSLLKKVSLGATDNSAFSKLIKLLIHVYMYLRSMKIFWK